MEHVGLPEIKNNKIYFTLVFLLLSLGLLLRFYGLEQYPLAVNQDELSNIYDGYSIAQTGADRFGDVHPVILRGFGNGDFRPSMCAWLVAGSVKLFGFSVFAGRLPSAILGWCSLVLLWLAAGKLGGRLFALLCLFFAVLSPWHILFSRMAHEGAIQPSFFLILSIYLWLVAKERDYSIAYLLLLGVAMGLGTNTYQSGKLIFFLFGLLVVYDLYKTNRKWMKYGGIVLAGALLGAMPQVIAIMGSGAHFFSRAKNTMKGASISFDYPWSIIRDLFSNLMPGFLFVQKGDYNNLSIYRLIPAELLFFYVGIFTFPAFIKMTDFKKRYIYLLVVFAILPAALANPNPHALRSSGMVILLPLFSAAGILYIGRYLRKPQYKTFYGGISLAAVIISFGAIVYEYTNSLLLRGQGQQNNMVQICKKVGRTGQPYKAVVFKYDAIQPYIYMASFGGITPGVFQQLKLVNDTTGEWDNVSQMGKYYFIGANGDEQSIDAQAVGNRLLVCRDPALPYQRTDSIMNVTGGDVSVFFYTY